VPTNSIVTPSATHSIVSTRLLSIEIAPKLATTEPVGTRWAEPQAATKAEAP
jgi:hypothetical protein